jgi:hypothetical protein
MFFMATEGSFYRVGFADFAERVELCGVFFSPIFRPAFLRLVFWAAVHRPSVTRASKVNVGSGDIMVLLIRSSSGFRCNYRAKLKAG